MRPDPHQAESRRAGSGTDSTCSQPENQQRQPAPALTVGSVTSTPTDVAIRGPVEAAIESAEDARQKPAASLCGPQQHRAERRTERQRAECREQHGNRDGEGKLLIDLSADSADEGYRNKDSSEDEGDRDDRAPTPPASLESLRRAASVPSSICRWTASTTTMASSTTMPMASTRPNMLVMLIENPSSGKQRKCADNRDGNSQQRNQSRTPVLQEDKHDQHDERDRLEQGSNHVADGFTNKHRRIVWDDVLDAGGKRALRLGH